MKKFKWQAAVVAFSLTLALAYFAISAIQRQTINKPLSERLREIAGVMKVELSKENKRQLVMVDLDYVDNLSETWQLINERTAAILGPGNYRLLIKDRRSPGLVQVYNTVHFALYEGEMKGNFTAMAREVEKTLNSAAVDEYRLFVDGSNIYLQMKNGEDYLLAVIDRKSRIKEGEQA